MRVSHITTTYNYGIIHCVYNTIAVHDDEYTLEDAVSGRLPKNAVEYTQHVEPLIQRTVDKCWSELTDKDKQALARRCCLHHVSQSCGIWREGHPPGVKGGV